MNRPLTAAATAGSCAVRVASPLRSYTQGAANIVLEMDSQGATLAWVLQALDRRSPGMRFRMIDEQDRPRPHIRMFVNDREVRSLDERLRNADTLHLICALSGG